MRLRTVFCLAGYLWCQGLVAGEIPLTSTTSVSFATIARGRQILTDRDEFIRALSPFDRSARMKTAGTVTEDAFIHFVGQNVVSWEPAETNRVAGLIGLLGKDLARWDLPLPS